ncbi:MAG: hypothetical protein Kow0031_10540 [Anaerolineae bacterium]
MASLSSSDRILPETRWLSAFVIPFLVVAFIILYLFPHQTELLFAWKLQPSMSAMMLGAAYAGGIYYFGAVLRASRWHHIKVGFVPVMVFASALGIATLLHWDRFNHGHISFYAWAGLYFTSPFLVLAVWLRNRPQDSGLPDANDVAIHRPVGWLMGVFGLATLLVSLFLFVQPGLMIELWPWTLSPLTARIVGAMFSLPGLVGLGIAADRRWSSARVILQAQSFSIVLILGAAARSWSDFDQSKPGTWLFVGGLVAMLACIVAFYLFF